ncbi:MAG: DNA cytosine methyltransferase [Chryseotalea sp. WA131a]|jgi:DNA (cytosine-5)-methyltransferase 1|nr:MAG: DNA cytosine methyltransferase [Chryseotalea sp. WA131a]
MHKIKAVSLFSGCGGFDYGVKQAGAEIIWANDNDQHAAYAYKSIFNDVDFHLGDIRKVKLFPQADILIGCYPCTGFSEAARRRWKELEERDIHQNDKNFLFEEFLRALKLVKPKFLFVENVRGMLSAGRGWFIQEQIRAFSELGYNITYSQVDASEYGVAQTRKRVFLVGVKKTIKDFKYSFPKVTHGSDGRNESRTLRDVIGGMVEWPEGEFYDGSFHGHYLTRNRKRAWDEPSFTIVAHGHHVPLHPKGSPMSFVSTDKWKLQGEFNRRLSWRECAKIQGLSSKMKLDGTLLDKYRVVGNSVPPKLSKVIVAPVLNYLNQ